MQKAGMIVCDLFFGRSTFSGMMCVSKKYEIRKRHFSKKVKMLRSGSFSTRNYQLKISRAKEGYDRFYDFFSGGALFPD